MDIIKTIMLLAAMAIIPICLMGSCVISYKECKNYFSSMYCLTHPEDWSKQKGLK